ncbi:hypothetical protein TRVA0_002S01860 [Trichomonascus vanleenenianus]|uniref:uncharacterized protein n=1 Tax=Trichomonascus vanleenenianus TaxID=2268995 RepID=UPI003EC9C81C
MTAHHTHELNPAYFLPRAAEIEPEGPAVVHRSRTGHKVQFTYGQLAQRVLALAHFLKAHGFKRIAILAPNTPAHLESLFAATAAGGIMLGLNYRLTEREILYKLDLGNADIVIADREFAHLVKNQQRPVLIDEDDTYPFSSTVDQRSSYSYALREGAKLAQDRGGWEALHVEDIEEDSLLGLFFTSGTTGNPKGVEYTHRGVYLCALANVIESQLNCGTPFGENRCRYLWTLPIFHAAGWTFPYAVTAVRGTHYCLRKVDVDYIWDILNNENITHFNAAPTVNTMILSSPKAKRLKTQCRVIVAAAPPSAKLFQEMIDHNFFPVHMYGLTETYGPLSVCYYDPKWSELPKEEMYAKLARQGHGFIVSKKLRVVTDQPGRGFVDVKKDGHEIGEIIARGNAVTKGYHRNEEETAKSFDQWFRSGDLAVMHPDGSIQILDRKKDIIISGGENISSVSVENTIVKHPSVLEAAVVGVPHKLYGEVPVAVLVLKSGHELELDDFIAWMKERMGGYQVPRKIVVVDELPKTATGKIRKNVLREKAKL